MMFDVPLLQSAEKLLELCRDKSIKIVTAESCTGGLLSGLLTEIAGSSDVFERGFVTYSNEAKVELLNVDPALLSAHGAVSSQVALAMAEGALANSHADLALSITGIAGPGGGTDEKPVGTVYFGCAAEQTAIFKKAAFTGLSRSLIRQQSLIQSLKIMHEAIAL
jgi:nicotinamide-nucleotide amidase